MIGGGEVGINGVGELLMEAPPEKMGVDAFIAFMKTHIETNYVRKGGVYVCRKDGSLIAHVTGWASLHSEELGDACGGPGKVARFSLPFCPICERKPKNTATCVHVPTCDFDAFNLAQLLQ